jgi:hypothetical protein
MRVMRSGNFLEVLNKDIKASGLRLQMFPPVRWTIGTKPANNRELRINHCMKTRSLILLVLVGFIIGFTAAESLSENKTEETKKIELLLARLEAMQNVVFIRNGKEYSSNKAADHLHLKWKKAGRYVKTAEDFIALCGSKSSSLIKCGFQMAG